ncbi:hypothetical protein EDB85DRAFT_2154907 [Lactarius pseudohatsudake]|nr:hypothetical protein EDB85DRAFT_2154907 [Lactarius pseudohatsudake]
MPPDSYRIGCAKSSSLPPSLPSPSPSISAAFPICVEKRTQEGQAGAPPHPLHRAPPRSRVDRDAPGKGAHMKRGGARGHAAPLPPPLPYPLSASPCSRGKVAHEGTPSHPSPPPPPCVPFACGAPSRRRLFSLSPPALPFPLVRAALYAQKGAREAGHPPPFPIRAEGGRTRAHRRLSASPPLPLSSPSLFAPPRSRGKGHARARHPRLHPSPFGRKGCTRARRPQYPFPLGRAAPYAREGGMRGHATPGPILPHSRGRAGARRHAAPFAREGAYEAKQGRRGLRAPAFTAPAPRFRAP